MAGASVEDADVHIGAGGARETFKEIGHQFGLEIAHARRADFGVDHGDGTPGKIDGGQAKRLVHGHEKVAGAQDAATVRQGMIEGFAEGDADFLDRVVLVDIQVAAGRKFQIESAVAREQFEHVVEEADAGGNFIFSSPIDSESEANVGLGGLAMQLGASWVRGDSATDHARTSPRVSSSTTSRKAAMRV